MDFFLPIVFFCLCSGTLDLRLLLPDEAAVCVASLLAATGSASVFSPPSGGLT